jgi:hypothetical protein
VIWIKIWLIHPLLDIIVNGCLLSVIFPTSLKGWSSTYTQDIWFPRTILDGCKCPLLRGCHMLWLFWGDVLHQILQHLSVLQATWRTVLTYCFACPHCQGLLCYNYPRPLCI